jgi:sterol desaturase/sphingolipid hydroxylase (fatty acid hydroxylase superfamily)
MIVLADTPVPAELLRPTKAAITVVLLAVLWGWESWAPFVAPAASRWRHAGRNLAVALLNTLVLGLAFGGATVAVAGWADDNRLGLLNALGGPWPVRLALALVLLDGWMYVWHRLNHAVPLLWRFHRMHHSDPAMDVTTATRFHLGEHVGAALARLGLIPLIGFDLGHLLAYDVLVIGVTQFHHSNVSLGRWDRPLRWLVVTPDFHKVHHSRWRPETDSNFATVLSVWDRLAGSYRMRGDLAAIEFGLDGFDAPGWQSVGGLLKTPFLDPSGAREAPRQPPASHPVPESREPVEAGG